MHWLLSEYILKGIFLGLVLFVALLQPTWKAIGEVFLSIVAGLGLFLGVAARAKIREGFRVNGRVPAFILFILLESPRLVYAGIMLGSLVGAWVVRGEENREAFLATFLSGAVLGVLFWMLRHVVDRRTRLGLGAAALAATLVGGGWYWFGYLDHPIEASFATVLLLGLPIFYLLTFVGLAEESEVEIGAMCAALGVGIWILGRESKVLNTPSILFAVPLALYFVYTRRVLPGLRVFKHVVRGIGYANLDQYRSALLAFRRALQLDPNNTLAREHFWALHRAIDMKALASDPETLALVDFELCLARVTTLLAAPKPTAAKLQEAQHLVELVRTKQPELAPVAAYWEAVALTHARQYEQAAALLTGLLEPTGYAGNPNRRKVLLQAWQLALTLHPELNRRAGTPQLALPGRRLEAIAAVERQLTDNAEDADAWNLKRLLYSNLTEEEYFAAAHQTVPDRAANSTAPAPPLPGLDFGYARQLGLALIQDTGRWERGAEYLRIAAHGLPQHGPSIYQQIAQAHERAGSAEEAQRYYEQGKQAGRTIGPANLSPEDRTLYFTLLKQLGDQARARFDFDAAIENYQLYSEFERAGLETLRTLADLYEKRGDALAALRTTEKALVYDAKDKDLLQRKEKYYYSVTPEQLRPHVDSLRNAFDVAYCMNKARGLLDLKDADVELIDWAQQLLDLAQVVQPNNISIKLLRTRALRRRGEIDAARQLLEETRAAKPEAFANGEDEEAWYLCCRLLGEMYLYELDRADLAVACLNDFRQSHKSGADTLYKLGQAYEKIGDRAKALKYYEHVTAYESHPLAPDARDAMYRLQSSA